MQTSQNDEKRRFHRIFYNADAVLQDADKLYPCKIIDLSLKGCLLDLGLDWPGSQDTLYGLSLSLAEDTKISMHVNLVHTFGTQYGFTCRNIDIDSISTLRRLVELNLGDSELLERELISLASLAG